MPSEDLPGGESERRRIAALDDASVARMAEGSIVMVEEMYRRKRFEAAWSGEWESGVRVPVPKRHEDRPASVSREMTRRAEFRKLCAQAKSGPKAQRDAARHLLKTSYGKSVA